MEAERDPVPFTEANLSTALTGNNLNEVVIPPALEADARRFVSLIKMPLHVTVDPELPANRWKLRQYRPGGVAAGHVDFMRAQREREKGPELAAALRKVTANLRDILRSDYETHDPSRLEALLERDGVLEAEALLKRIDEGTPKLIDHGSTGHHFVKDGGRRPWTLVGFEMRDGERVAVFHSCGHPSQVTTAPESEFPRWSEVTAEEADAMIPKGAPP